MRAFFDKRIPRAAVVALADPDVGMSGEIDALCRQRPTDFIAQRLQVAEVIGRKGRAAVAIRAAAFQLQLARLLGRLKLKLATAKSGATPPAANVQLSACVGISNVGNAVTSDSRRFIAFSDSIVGSS